MLFFLNYFPSEFANAEFVDMEGPLYTLTHFLVTKVIFSLPPHYAVSIWRKEILCRDICKSPEGRRMLGIFKEQQNAWSEVSRERVVGGGVEKVAGARS